MTVSLQKLALIQPRTSLSRYADAYLHQPPPVISSAVVTLGLLLGLSGFLDGALEVALDHLHHPEDTSRGALRTLVPRL